MSRHQRCRKNTVHRLQNESNRAHFDTKWISEKISCWSDFKSSCEEGFILLRLLYTYLYESKYIMVICYNNSSYSYAIIVNRDIKLNNSIIQNLSTSLYILVNYLKIKILTILSFVFNIYYLQFNSFNNINYLYIIMYSIFALFNLIRIFIYRQYCRLYSWFSINNM